MIREGGGSLSLDTTFPDEGPPSLIFAARAPLDSPNGRSVRASDLRPTTSATTVSLMRALSPPIPLKPTFLISTAQNSTYRMRKLPPASERICSLAKPKKTRRDPLILDKVCTRSSYIERDPDCPGPGSHLPIGLMPAVSKRPFHATISPDSPFKPRFTEEVMKKASTLPGPGDYNGRPNMTISERCLNYPAVPSGTFRLQDCSEWTVPARSRFCVCSSLQAKCAFCLGRRPTPIGVTASKYRIPGKVIKIFPPHSNEEEEQKKPQTPTIGRVIFTPSEKGDNASLLFGRK